MFHFQGTVCRLCLIKTDAHLEIFGPNGKQLHIAQVIEQHFWLKISEPNNVGNTVEIVCQQCWRQLSEFHQFYTNIERVHGRISFANVKIENSDYNGFGDDNIFVDDGNTTFLDDSKWEDVGEPESKPKLLKKKRYKSEQVEAVVDGESGLKVPKKKRKRIKIIDTTGLKKTRKKQKIKEELRNEEKSYESQDKRNEYYRTFFNMDCELCSQKCYSLTENRIHYKKVHNQPGYVTCCSKNFTTTRGIREHIAQHVNPQSLTCDHCQKGFTHKRRLRDHILTHIDMKSRPYKCDQCEKTFIKPCQLNTHLKVKHATDEEKIHRCDECEKRFAMPHQLQTHKTQTHGGKNSYICHICAKNFTSITNFLTHKRMMHDRPMPPVQCGICGIWLTHQYNLRKHMRLHNDVEQTCPFCLRVLKNQRTFRKHMAELHSTDRKRYNCNLCGKEYLRPLSLLEHMSSHTGAILYTCTFCSKTFNSSANMYKHRKIVHPTEYLKWKDESTGPGAILKSAALFTAYKDL